MRFAVETILALVAVGSTIWALSLQSKVADLELSKFDYTPNLVNDNLILQNTGDETLVFESVRLTPIFKDDVIVPGIGGQIPPNRPLELAASSALTRTDGVRYFKSVSVIICEQPRFAEKCASEKPYQLQVEVLRGNQRDSEVLVF